MKIEFPGYCSRTFVRLFIFLILAACSSSPPTIEEQAIQTPIPTQNPTPTGTISKAKSEGAVRSSYLAGTWYPADREELENITSTLLEMVTPIEGKPMALIVPHAGYVYSGPVAAFGFKQIEAYDFEVAVIIAADHQPPISDRISIWSEGGFETPMGVVPVNAELAKEIVDSDPLITSDTGAHAGEHPIEIQLPFLQSVCPDCTIVPILMGDTGEESVQALSDALGKHLKDRNAVVIASSDLSHYPKYDHALAVDSETLSAVEVGDPVLVQKTIQESLSAGIPNLATCACGEGPIFVAMQVAQDMGSNTITLLSYANSGDSPYGDKEQVVGYGAVMFWQYEPLVLSNEQKAQLISLARGSIEEYLEIQKFSPFESNDADFNHLSNVFVTLKKGEELRGCVGQIKATLPLGQAVQQAAISAASEDPRFPPLEVEELPQLTIEISILSPFKRITDIETIEVGNHGLLIYKSGQSGLLLPQVAVQEGWNREEFLENLCLKASLPEDCWQENAALYVFETTDFGEE
jgi:AmmeMemoRadiSam system protein B/AmmeMemoRadiSam system protein A